MREREPFKYYKPAPGLGYTLLSEVHEFCESKFPEIVDKCLENSLNIKALDLSKKMRLFNLTYGRDIFVMFPTGFGKSLIFNHLLVL